MIGIDNETLTEAVVVWTGRGRNPFPARDDDRLIAQFGVELGRDLIPMVHRLRDDFYGSDASDTVGDLAAMGDKAAADFRARHPEIGEKAVQALKWCYTYDDK